MRKITLIISLCTILLIGCFAAAPLRDSAEKGDIEAVKRLLDQGYPVDKKEAMTWQLPDGLTALMEAAYYGRNDIVELLIDRGANVNAVSSSGSMSALMLAAAKGQVDTVKLLLKRGADINTPMLQLEKYAASPSNIIDSSSAKYGIKILENFAHSSELGAKDSQLPFGSKIANTSQPVTDSIVQTPAEVASLDFGSYNALVVGNNEYLYLPKLRTAVNDARVMSNLLQDKYGFKVRLIMNATRADILRAINGFRRTLSVNDNFLIYYAGHGWLDKGADQGYWLPVDATEQDPTNWISNGSITDSLRAMAAKHVLVIADSCYSGKLARGINVRIRTKNYYEKISKKKARTVMASGGLEPVADEGGKGSHSVFASALIETLNENQGILDGTLLFSQIRRPVMVNADQTPEYSDIRKAGHDGGDFLFVRQK